jgi:DNA-binding LacI/PurR family transcriptional regulator
VLNAVEEFEYSPNLHARSLAGGKNRSIGVIDPELVLRESTGPAPAARTCGTRVDIR